MQIHNLFLKYDQKRQVELERNSNKLASGKRILKPSDAPVDLAQSLRYKSFKSEIEGFLRNIDMVKNTQEIAEGALNNIVESGQEIRVELVHILNTGVLDADDAKVLRDFFKGMRDYLIDEANVKIGDHYLFSGTKSQTAPIDNDGVYQGNTAKTTVPIAKNVESTIRFNGKNFLGIGTIEGQEKMIMTAVLDKVIAAIDSGDLSHLHDSDFLNINGHNYALLEAFDLGLNGVMSGRSSIGSQRKTTENIEEQHQMFEVSFNNLISKLEDADFTKTISELEKNKVAYEATMQSYNQNRKLSLLDYLH